MSADRAASQGASGGGCSTLYTAHSWQAQVAGYSANGCGTKRLTGDIAADADPNTGFDVYDMATRGWMTFGGTSLSSPLMAAMWALAGGRAASTTRPRSLYYNLSHNPSSVYDVRTGGNSFCGGDSQAHCAAAVKTIRATHAVNPNNLHEQLL